MFWLFYRKTSALDKRNRRTNCQLSNLPANSLVSSDLEYAPTWVIYDKLDRKECDTALLLNQPPTQNDNGMYFSNPFNKIDTWCIIFSLIPSPNDNECFYSIDNFRLCLYWIHLRKFGCGKGNTFWEQGRVFPSVQAPGPVSNICLFSVSILIKMNIRDIYIFLATYFCITQSHIHCISLAVL